MTNTSRNIKIISAGIFLLLFILNPLSVFEFFLGSEIGYGFTGSSVIRIAFFYFIISLTPILGLFLRKFLKIRSILAISSIILFSGMIPVIIRLVYSGIFSHGKGIVIYANLLLEETIITGIILGIAGLFVFAKKDNIGVSDFFPTLPANKHQTWKLVRKISSKVLVVFIIIVSVHFVWDIVFRAHEIYASIVLRNYDYEIVEMKYNASGLSLELEKEVDGKLYNVVFHKVKKGSFTGNFPIVISELNGFKIKGCSCYNGTIAYPFAINIQENKIITSYLEIQEINIFWIMDNIDAIEKRFMEIPDDGYLNISTINNDEIYYKRIHKDLWNDHSRTKDLYKDPTLFTFENCRDLFHEDRQEALKRLGNDSIEGFN